MTDELKRLLELAGVDKKKVSVDSLGKKRLDERGQYWRQKMHRDMQTIQTPPVPQAPETPEMEEGWLEDEGVPMGAHLPQNDEVVVVAFDDGDMEVEENDRDDAEYDYGHRRGLDPRDDHPEDDDDEGMEDLKGQDRSRWDRRRGTKGSRKSREDYDAERDEMYDSAEETPALRFSYSVNQDQGIFIKDDREMREAFLEGDEAYDCLSQLEMAGDDEKRVQVVLSQYDHRMQEAGAGMLEAYTTEYNEVVNEHGDYRAPSGEKINVH